MNVKQSNDGFKKSNAVKVLKQEEKQKGFTLIEVLITLSLVAIIMSVIITLFSTGTKSFSLGQTKTSLQSDMRLGLEMIENEIRYADDITLVENNPDSFFAEDNSHQYIYYDEGKIKRSFYDESQNKIVTKEIPGLYEKSEFFRFNPDLSNVLEVTLKSREKDMTYNLKTKVKLLNLESNNKEIKTETKNNQAEAIRFR